MPLLLWPLVSGETGTGASAQATQTASGTGVLTIAGSAASVQGAQTVLSSAQEIIAALGAAAQGAQTAAGSGGLGIAGTGGPAQDGQAVAASGSALFPVFGTGAALQDAQTVAASGATFAPAVGASFTAGDEGVQIVLDFMGFVAIGGTCTLYALPAIPPSRRRVAYRTALPLTPVVIASDGLTATYTTTGSDIPSGGNWVFQARVQKPSEQAFMSSPRQFYVYPHL